MITNINEFKTFLENNSEYVNLKTYDIKKLYQQINKECFNNELEQIPILIKPIKGATAKYNATIKNNTKEYPLTKDDKITISSLIQFTEEKLKNVLCHEMLHYWIGSRITTKESHGPNFLAGIKRINNLGLGYTITTKDEDINDYNQELNIPEQIFITGNIGAYTFYLLISKSIVSKMYKEEIKSSLNKLKSKSLNIKYYITTAPESKQLQNSKDFNIKYIKQQYKYIITDLINLPKTKEITAEDIINYSTKTISESTDFITV